jgi:hypothetical protein
MSDPGATAENTIAAEDTSGGAAVGGDVPPSVVELWGDATLDVSGELILGDKCNVNELGDTSDPGAPAAKGDPGVPAASAFPGDAVERKFEPGVTVEPKVAVIPGATTQGNTHPADRPGDTAKRKIARERQGQRGRPEPGTRNGDASAGRSSRRTAHRGGYQAPSCLARGRS